ncbi:hypothetical protein JCM10296v2_000434 [Rhodotorula toruloides]
MTGNATKPAQRLEQVANHLSASSSSSSPKPVHAHRFRLAIPKGLPVNHTPLNPVSFLLKAASIRPGHPAIVYGPRVWNFESWAGRIAKLAYAFKARGLQEGDRVVVLAPNVPFMSDALQALPAAKLVMVTVNTRLNPSEVAYILEDSGAKLVLVDHSLAHLLPKDSKAQVVVCQDSYDASDPYEQFLEEGAAYDRKLGGKEWAGLEVVKDEEALFAISYTSGTTSKPKGVMTTFRGTYLAGIANAVEARLTDSSRFLWTLPMFHCVGWCFPFACTMAMCSQYCLRTTTLKYDDIWALLKSGVTHYNAAPTVQIALVSHEKAQPLSHDVRTIIAGAAPTAKLIEQLEKLNIGVVHVYGMSESYGPFTRTYYVEKSSPTYYRDMARQGYSFLTADDIRVVRLTPEGSEPPIDPETGDLQEVRPNGEEVGEIVFRGNIVMQGYWRKEKATREAFAGGWMHSGDLAVRYPDGTGILTLLHPLLAHLVISGGENISSLAVENELAAHDDVHECAVVARPHEKWGERPHAFVVLKPGSKWHGKHAEFETELKTFGRKKLSAFAVPEWIEVVAPEELPKTSTGKIQKVALRERVRKLSQ